MIFLSMLMCIIVISVSSVLYVRNFDKQDEEISGFDIEIIE